MTPSIPDPEGDEVLIVYTSNQEDVGDLIVAKGVCDHVEKFEGNSFHHIRSVWHPTPEEREAITNGGSIELHIIGTYLPPMAIGVLE